MYNLFMEKNNKKRILTLIEILRKETSLDRHLKLDEIVIELEKRNIQVDNRKTLYDDFKVLNDFNINVEYDNGYYLLDAPFNLSEIKIIQDSINSLKNLDTNFMNEINEKLYTFISNDEAELLDKLKYVNKHSNKKLLPKMEDVLYAIKNNQSIVVKRKNKENQEVFPLFIHRENDYYYFYFHYPNSDKIYHYRFDNIETIILKDKLDSNPVSIKKVIKHINESSNSFYLKQAEAIKIKIINNLEYTSERLKDDFPQVIINNDTATIFASLNNVFYSKLLAYGRDIKIADKNISDKYLNYLDDIKAIYLRK